MRGNPLNEEFEKLVQKTLDLWHVPGIAVAVVDGDNTWAQGYGVASFPSTPVTPSTLFYAGSTTKAFTSAIMATLVEDNETYPHVQWDTPISDLIRDDFVLENSYATEHVTIEDALSHRTGLPSHDAAYGNRLSRDVAAREMVRQLRHLPLTAEPRTQYQYCNLMFVAASHVIQTLTGEWLGDSLAHRIWEPLRMTATFFSREDALSAKEDLARGYSYSPEKGFKEVEWMPLDEISGAGSVITNVLDYAKWARALINREKPLSEETYKAIWEPRTLIPHQAPFTGPLSYALGWQIGVYKGVQFYEHSGGMNAFGAELILIPELKYSVTILGNTALTSNCVSHTLAFHLIDEKLDVPPEKRFDWNQRDLNTIKAEREKNINSIQRFYPNLPSPTLPTAVSLQKYTGTYFHPGYQKVDIYLDKSSGVLRADREDTTWPEYMSFEHVSGEYFVIKSEHEGDYGAFFPETYPAEFRVGTDGNPYELGIGWNKQMKEKIWLKRI
ncbi:beta-lactamase/transpeptidase-like protein [Talaromyces proteolyticus]|uniref:Beta-lactamase/transpeptidase-like protein n=1 Tax=Talaromyces proteolyticus TaxID=1131652 RepID=A0AAD4KZZ5_9EURO|nr:beta-lactamase/transpeptidase-like protein [Talaromyces proteolyticus]KAH8700965.1 beta-lactamase/transpeptidase-like protein [Talaromyces proteolyticus]